MGGQIDGETHFACRHVLHMPIHQAALGDAYDVTSFLEVLPCCLNSKPHQVVRNAQDGPGV